MAELTGERLSRTVLDYTNFHRRFGLGNGGEAGAPEWAPYAAALDGLDGLADQLALTHATFLTMPEEPPTRLPRVAFGCFGCDPPADNGDVQIHFNNRDTDAAGGPLAEGKLAARQAEVAAMVAHIHAAHPDARAIRGRSWLYGVAAYRRVFPPAYSADPQVVTQNVSLHGNSIWGQAIDSREQVRADVRDAVLAALPGLDPAAPWRAFPRPVLTVSAPLSMFAAFYGLGA